MAKSENITKNIIDLSNYKGVWIIAEQRNSEVLNVAKELIGEGKKLAKSINTEVTAVLLGNNMYEWAEQLVKFGADKVIYAEHELLDIYTTDAYAKVIFELINSRNPEIVIFGATTIGRELAPTLSAKINTGLTADCTRLEIDLENSHLLQTRPAFGGNIMATIICPNHRPQMCTVRPGVMEKAKYDESLSTKGKIEKITPILSDNDIRAKVLKMEKCDVPEVALEDAPIIVSGGRGLGDANGFDLIKKLADKIGGVVGSSRACVDSEWIDIAHQVGQTGKTVRPKLYIACGISGAIQHIAGMSEAECIVAINKNPDAPIFKIAHYGIIGDLYKVIPEIINALDNVEDIVQAFKKLS
ncbi:MAG: electron transfer flavoprotein subunit alpha/FixB family protein [Candidatus Lokiarchaeota archaeon]|nr:electron transfer flavoprotein subunit alpha/FixB family protein [Candidatus Lokiarchaeota archaeon]